MWPWLLWRLWKSRNDLIYSNLDSDPQRLVKQAEDDAKEWLEANRREEERRVQVSAPSLRRTAKWIPPPIDTWLVWEHVCFLYRTDCKDREFKLLMTVTRHF